MTRRSASGIATLGRDPAPPERIGRWVALIVGLLFGAQLVEDETRAGRASGIGMTLGFAGAIVMPPAFGATVEATGSHAAPFLAVAVGVGAASIGALCLAGRSTGAGPMRSGGRSTARRPPSPAG
ncbi:MAG TPA: hypothetical protein VF195_08355 [Actinomycetota bacterium]